MNERDPIPVQMTIEAPNFGKGDASGSSPIAPRISGDAGSPGPPADSGDASSSFCYPGGKGGDGVYQRLINLMPPHEVYIETHLGGGAIMRNKKPARFSIGIDIDPAVLGMWQALPGSIVLNTDASGFLTGYNFKGQELVYSDPPYLMQTRKSGKLYNFEYTDQQHIELLTILKSLPCMVMISGYWSELYADMLAGWNIYTFNVPTRRGGVLEYVWYNYEKPTVLHDYTYLGDTYRQRERIKRKRNRWVRRLMAMPAVERNALLDALNRAGSPRQQQR